MRTNLLARLIASIICFSFYLNGKAQIWSPLGTGTDMKVDAIASYNSELYVGGDFKTAGGLSANYIARWNGVNWDSVGSGVNGAVTALAIYNGELYAGGSFSPSTTSSYGIAKWNGTSWSTVGKGVYGLIQSLTLFNGQLYAGGRFDSAGGISAHNIATWNGSVWSALGTGITSSYLPEVEALCSYNGKLYAGGSFTTAGSIPARNIAAWDGTNWSALGLGINSYGANVISLCAYNSTLVVGGSFDTAGTIQALAIAQWDGSNWGAMSSPGTPLAMTVYNSDLISGNLYGAKSFNGNTWSQMGQSIPIYSMAICNSALYIGGRFQTSTSPPLNNIAVWNSTNGIPEDRANRKLRTFPNPVLSEITFESEDFKGGYSLLLFDIAGRQIYSHSILSKTETLDISKLGLAPGVYSFQANMGNENLGQGKFIVTGK